MSEGAERGAFTQHHSRTTHRLEPSAENAFPGKDGGSDVLNRLSVEGRAAHW